MDEMIRQLSAKEVELKWEHGFGDKLGVFKTQLPGCDGVLWQCGRTQIALKELKGMTAVVEGLRKHYLELQKGGDT